MRPLAAGLVAAWMAVCLPGDAQATKIFETATMGAPGQMSGVTIDDEFFVGVRFQAESTVTTGSIGGHFGGGSFTTSDIFAAVLKIPDLSAQPSAADLTLSNLNLLGVTLITLPSAFSGSDDFAANLAVDLTAGDFYALIFGSGLFGATGSGFATKNNAEIGTPSYFNIKEGDYLANNNTMQTGTRFFLDSQSLTSVPPPPPIPEPGSIVLSLIAAAALLAYGWHKRRARVIRAW